LIFVTVGNSLQGFDRLMKEIDRLKDTGALHGEVVVQYGHSNFLPRGCKCVSSVSREEFKENIAKSSLVITHGGAGSIGKCLLSGKKPVVVPRRKIFGEVVNDHQLELVRELEHQGRIYAVYDIACLPDAVRGARERGVTQPPASAVTGVGVLVKNFLDRLADEKVAGR